MIAWARREGYGTLFLHASDSGRPLYEHRAADALR